MTQTPTDDVKGLITELRDGDKPVSRALNLKAADALARLSSQEAGEPVAWRYSVTSAWGEEIVTVAPADPANVRGAHNIQPLYLHPAPANRDAVIEALRRVHKIIADAAVTGFNWKDGDWADRLFASQAQTYDALHPRTPLGGKTQMQDAGEPVAALGGKEGRETDERVRIEYDGFEGTVQGHYTTREGKRGVVVQQDGTKVVHVYGEARVALATNPPAPSDEVRRLRSALAPFAKLAKGISLDWADERRVVTLSIDASELRVGDLRRAERLATPTDTNPARGVTT